MLDDVLIVRTRTVRIISNERLREVRRRLQDSAVCGWSVLIQCKLRKAEVCLSTRVVNCLGKAVWRQKTTGCLYPVGRLSR